MISECLDDIYKSLEDQGFDAEAVLEHEGIGDDEDLTCFALRYLLSNLDDAIIEPFLDALDDEEQISLP